MKEEFSEERKSYSGIDIVDGAEGKKESDSVDYLKVFDVILAGVEK